MSNCITYNMDIYITFYYLIYYIENNIIQYITLIYYKTF